MQEFPDADRAQWFGVAENGHRQTGPVGPFRVKDGSCAWLVTRPAALLKVGRIRPLPLQTAYLPLFAQEILCHQHVVVVATVLLESILL
jgi:hypothetical protein